MLLTASVALATMWEGPKDIGSNFAQHLKRRGRDQWRFFNLIKGPIQMMTYDFDGWETIMTEPSSGMAS